MMRVITAVAGIVLVLFLTPIAASAANEAPTYNQDVGPILYSNCSSCHRPNQIAPMSLLSYKDARPWARAIKSKVEAREMPPWFADPRFGEFANDTSLSDEDIATITDWVDAGAPEGDGPSPTAPTFSAAGWSHPDGLEPDFIYEAPFEWHIDAEGESPNFNLYSKMPFDDARMVAATQLRPGNYAATHHIVTGALNVPPGLVIGTGPAWPGGPVTDYTMVPDPNADPALLKKIAAATAAGGAGPRTQPLICPRSRVTPRSRLPKSSSKISGLDSDHTFPVWVPKWRSRVRRARLGVTSSVTSSGTCTTRPPESRRPPDRWQVSGGRRTRRPRVYGPWA